MGSTTRLGLLIQMEWRLSIAINRMKEKPSNGLMEVVPNKDITI